MLASCLLNFSPVSQFGVQIRPPRKRWVPYQAPNHFKLISVVFASIKLIYYALYCQKIKSYSYSGSSWQVKGIPLFLTSLWSFRMDLRPQRSLCIRELFINGNIYILILHILARLVGLISMKIKKIKFYLAVIMKDFQWFWPPTWQRLQTCRGLHWAFRFQGLQK